jgi:predicted transcriptional regulator
MATRNVTLSLPEDLVRRAKVLAAQRDTSVSALTAEALTQLVGGLPDYAAAWGEEERLMEQGIGLRVGEISWSRDDLHSR